ncbi:MAG TPA: DUF2090 domain-containing protein [Actinomycetes bacterium]|nr:DUF2090 domain-containing protein [Actinomycetes bacterium]
MPQLTSRLYVVSFDHRASFRRDLFGLVGAVSTADMARVRSAKRVIFDGFLWARASGAVEPSRTGVLVDTQTGGHIAASAKRRGILLAIPVERGGGQAVFEFDHGAEFGAHIERHDPDYAKVLVKYNPEGDQDANTLQRRRLRRLSGWLRERGRRLLFELLVPPEPDQLRALGGDAGRFDRDLRPGLVAAAVAELQASGVEPDIWKLEGLERRADCALVAAQCRSGGRGHVACVVLGRGAATARVRHWLCQAAAVDGFAGFAVGRTIWSEPLRAWLGGDLDRPAAAAAIGRRYLDLVRTFDAARRERAPS